MRRLLRTLLTGLLASLALLAPTVAHAADPEAARRGASWLVAESPGFEGTWALGDVVLAHGAAQDPADSRAAAAVLERVWADAAGYARATPEGAARLVILAVPLGADPRDVRGVDAVALVRSGIADDGTFGESTGPNASALAAVALSRAGEDIPGALIDDLLSYGGGDGGFSAERGGESDAESTAMAILALLTVGSPEATDARNAAIGWAWENVRGDGSWDGNGPLSATATMASALASAGEDPADAVAWLATQQDETGAFPDAGEGDASAIITAQAVLGLAGVSLLDVEIDEAPVWAWISEGSIPPSALVVAGIVALVAGGVLLLWPARKPTIDAP